MAPVSIVSVPSHTGGSSSCPRRCIALPAVHERESNYSQSEVVMTNQLAPPKATMLAASRTAHVAGRPPRSTITFVAAIVMTALVTLATLVLLVMAPAAVTMPLGVALGIGSITVVVLLSKQRRTQRDASAGRADSGLAGLFIFRIAAMHRP